MTMIQDFRDIRPADSTDRSHAFDRLLCQLAAPPTRRTARLVQAGTARKARKLVEEATEVSLDAVAGNRRGVIEESVDLLYHLAVLWHDRGIDPAEVWTEMDRRADILGIAEKLPKKGAARKALKRAALYRKGSAIGPVTLTTLREG